MIKPDVILTWPKNCDYPIWRQFIHEERHRFNEIILVFMETNQGYDYREFVRGATFKDHILCVDSPMIPPDADWRNIAVNFGLQQSLHSEWLWFTEQDFFPMSGFFDLLYLYMEGDALAVGVHDGPRLHPCSLFIKRQVLNSTSKNFGIVPGKIDHFGLIQLDIEKIERDTGRKIAIMPQERYKHMAGLSHNYSLMERGEAPNYKPDEFKNYLRNCFKVKVPLSKRFIEVFGKTVGVELPL